LLVYCNALLLRGPQHGDEDIVAQRTAPVPAERGQRLELIFILEVTVTDKDIDRWPTDETKI